MVFIHFEESEFFENAMTAAEYPMAWSSWNIHLMHQLHQYRYVCLRGGSPVMLIML